MEMEAPVFRPTMAEFENFVEYVSSIEPQVKGGICKIVAPLEWKNQFDYSRAGDIEIPAPIRQFVEGNKGVYQLALLEGKSIKVSDFKEMADKETVPKNGKYNHDSVERTFWKNVRFNPPTYGADMVGTFMDNVQSWNMNKLGCILQVLGADIPGITVPYLYFGMWKAMFAWHVEDMNLFSINYLHFGEPKSWWTVAAENGHRLESLAQGLFPLQYQECPEFLRHKTSLISPQILQRNSIPVTRAVQTEGEFVITFPYAYHCGFNHGFNCAESVNFALESWIDWGKKSGYCECRDDTVRFNMVAFDDLYKYWQENGTLPAVESPTKPLPPLRKMMSPKKKAKVTTEEAIPSAAAVIIAPPTQEEGEGEENVEIMEEQEPKKPRGTKRSPRKPKRIFVEEECEEGEEDFLEGIEESMEMEALDLSSQSPRKKKKLTEEDESKMLDCLVQCNGIPDRAARVMLALEMSWTAVGVYNWCRREWKSQTRLRHREPNGSQDIAEIIVDTADSDVEERDEVKHIDTVATVELQATEPEAALKEDDSSQGKMGVDCLLSSKPDWFGLWYPCSDPASARRRSYLDWSHTSFAS